MALSRLHPKLAEIARKIADITSYSASIIPEVTTGTSLLKRCVKALGRFYYSIHQRKYSRAQAVHYFHDPRLAKFTPDGMGQFATKSNSFPSITQCDVLFAFQVAYFWAYILLQQSPRRLISDSNGIESTALDLANLWVLSQRRGITHICTSAHFQAYVPLVGELRKAGVIERYSGVQHGAWAKSKLDHVTRDTGYDDYMLLDERYIQPFREYFDRQGVAEIQVQPKGRGILWQSLNRPHFAIALQNDDYDNDLKIAEICHRVASQHGVEVIIYVHPHPATTPDVIEKFSEYGTLERSSTRYGDSLGMITRYSTLAMEFAVHGGQAIFVDVGELIVFDTSGIRSSVVSMSGLSEEISKAISGQSVQVA